MESTLATLNDVKGSYNFERIFLCKLFVSEFTFHFLFEDLNSQKRTTRIF